MTKLSQHVKDATSLQGYQVSWFLDKLDSHSLQHNVTQTQSQDINNIKAKIKSVIKHIKSYNKSDDIIVESCCIRHQNTHFINHEVPQLVASRRSFVSKYILSNTVVSTLVTLLYLAQPARLFLHNAPSLLPITDFRQTSEVWLTATVITINWPTHVEIQIVFRRKIAIVFPHLFRYLSLYLTICIVYVLQQ